MLSNPWWGVEELPKICGVYILKNVMIRRYMNVKKTAVCDKSIIMMLLVTNAVSSVEAT
jgi:hypothetical protein